MSAGLDTFDGPITGQWKPGPFEPRDWLAAGLRSPMSPAVGLALFCHLLLLWLAIARLDANIGVDVSPVEGIAVELVDAAVFDRRSRGLTRGADAVDNRAQAPAARATKADAEALPSPVQDQPAAQPTPPAPAEPPIPASPAVPASAAKNVPKALSTTLDSSFQIPKSGKLELDAQLPSVGKAASMPPPQRAANATQSPLERYLERNSRAGGAQSGVVDEFTRMVTQIIEQNRPLGSPVSGTVVVEFVISPAGAVEDLRVTESSGKPALDNMALTVVRRGRYFAPPVTATLRDRTFEVKFKYE